MVGPQEQGGQFQLLASAGDNADSDLSAYTGIIESALANPVADIHEMPGKDSHSVLCFPVVVEKIIRAAVLLDPGTVSTQQLGQAMRHLQWGVAQLESFFSRRVLRQQQLRTGRIVSSLELALSTLDQGSLLGAARALTTEIAIKLGAERVSLGIIQGKHAEVLAMSHTAQFAAEANFVRLIASAMDEAIDQHNLVLLPQNSQRDSAPITWANRDLHAASTAVAICTVPFQHGESFAGALLIEFADESSLNAGNFAVIEAITAMMAPVLDLYQRNERSILKRCRDGLEAQLQKLTGPEHVMFKSVSALLVIFILFISLADGDYRVTADASLEGRELRAAVTPFDGYIDETFHRAGDVVEEGVVLAHLDDADLVLQLNKWRAKRQQMLRRLREAKAEKNNADLRVVQAQLLEASAEIELLEANIQRTQILAPFDGYIVSGDLSESLGAPRSRGEVLFEMAPLDDYRVMVKVDERDISSIVVGQQGQLLLKGYSDQALQLTVTRITPVAAAQEGLNAFEVEAELANKSMTGLLPGMEGVVKLQAGQATYIWIWTHRIWQWLRLWVWSWWP